MYQVDLQNNCIIEIPATDFGTLALRERQHLQEWLAKCPRALGEELLIIQKEFDGFYDTRERLDLLALDKKGALVIIENKLDDSGRDVVWQSLKYASYCSTLSKSQIADIFQEYLDKNQLMGNAKQLICEFINSDDFDAINLNQGNSQRIIMVAAHFRKEVTSTVLWLLGNGLQIQCHKSTLYQLDSQLFLSLEQVIPVPEAEEFMISMSAKEQEQQTVERSQSQRFLLRKQFWTQLLESFKNANIDLYSSVSPSQDHWLSTGSGMSGAIYSMIFGKDICRVEFYLKRDNDQENKYLFDHLYKKKETIEQRFGGSLVWERLNDKKACRIQLTHAIDGYNKDNWATITHWLMQHITKLEKSFKPEVEELYKLSKKLNQPTNKIEN
jgi:hypothetical protein